MILIILGLILYFFSRNADRDIRTSKFATPAKYIGFLLIITGILSSMVKQVEAGSVGVQKLFGKVEDGILDQAQLNAEIFLERLFNTLGYLRVIYE